MTFCCKLRLERLQSYSGIGQIICSLASRDRMQFYGDGTNSGRNMLAGMLQSLIRNLQSKFFTGVLAQLVERLNGIEEVTGSNPVGSSFFCKSPAASPALRLYADQLKA